MQRRQFLRHSTTSAVAGGLATTGLLAACGADAPDAGSAAVAAQPRVRWRLVSSFPRGLDTIFGGAEVLAERVAALTGGRFEVRVSPAGEIVPYDGVLDAVSRGTAAAGHTAGYYFTGKNPLLALDTGVPFGLTARQHNAWLYHGGGRDALAGVWSDFGVRAFPGGNTGTQMGGWFRRPIGSLADLRGLKMRIPGLGGRVMDQLGVSVQQIGGGEIFPALERGALDATEWVGPYDDLKLGFHKVARHYLYPGWWEPGAMLTFVVNQAEWDRLPAAYQQAFEVAAAEVNGWMLAAYDAKNPPALRELVAGGTDVQPFPADVMEAAARASAEVLDDLLAGDLYDGWKRWRADGYAFFNTAEQAFAQFAFPRLTERTG